MNRKFPTIPWWKLAYYRIFYWVKGECKEVCWGWHCNKGRWPHKTHEGSRIIWRDGKVIAAALLKDIIRMNVDDTVTVEATEDHYENPCK
jgi:hypothetical protein